MCPNCNHPMCEACVITSTQEATFIQCDKCDDTNPALEWASNLIEFRLALTRKHLNRKVAGHA